MEGTHTTTSTNLPAVPELLKNPDFFGQVVGMMRQNQMIAKLGDGEAFFLTEAGQTKRAFKVKVNLEYGKHFAFPAGPEQKAMILGEGYDFINQYSGIEIIRPKTLMAQDGSERGNPYFERDEKTGSITSMFIRGLAIGYSPTGNLVAIDKTIFVNLPTLLVQELQAKIKKHPSLGMMGTRDQRPNEITYYNDNGKWGRNRVIDKEPTVVKAQGSWHFVALTGDLGYWVNISHPEIQAAFESFSQKQRFLDRSAGTILNRLLLAQHPAIATKTPIVTELNVTEDYGKKVQSAKAHVFVYGFTADANPKQKRDDIVAMADRIAAGEDAANLAVKIEKTGVTDVTTEAEIVDETHAEADPSEIQTPVIDDGTQVEEPPATTATKSQLRFYTCADCNAVMTVSEPMNGCNTCGSIEIMPHESLITAREYVAKQRTSSTAAKNTGTPAEATEQPQDLTKFLNDKNTNRKIACKVRDEMNFDDFAALRKADAAKVAEFFTRYNAAAAVKE